MHTPAPEIEQGGGWLNNTLPKTLWEKRQRKISNLDGNQYSWCQMTKAEDYRYEAHGPRVDVH